MFYVYCILAAVIFLYENYYWWQEKPRKWSKLIAVSFLLIGAMGYLTVYNFELIDIPPLTKGWNTLLEALWPSFYDFMQV